MLPGIKIDKTFNVWAILMASIAVGGWAVDRVISRHDTEKTVEALVAKDKANDQRWIALNTDRATGKADYDVFKAETILYRDFVKEALLRIEKNVDELRQAVNRRASRLDDIERTTARR